MPRFVRLPVEMNGPAVNELALRLCAATHFLGEWREFREDPARIPAWLCTFDGRMVYDHARRHHRVDGISLEVPA